MAAPEPTKVACASERPSAASTASSAAPERDKRPTDSPRAAISKEMEDEIYSMLGALLGMLEVLSIDVQEPLLPRQQRFVAEALRFGDMLRARVEGLVTLFSDQDDPRFRRVSYPLRRLIDHSVRAASWAAAERGVSVVLPAGESLQESLLCIDAPRVDRAVRAITDTLVAAVGAHGQVVLRIDDRAASVLLELSAKPADAEPGSARLQLSAILLSAWERVFKLQRGNLSVDASALRICIELPKTAAQEQT